jgi:hypothetical protein
MKKLKTITLNKEVGVFFQVDVFKIHNLKFEIILGGSMSEILGGYWPNEAGGKII